MTRDYFVGLCPISFLSLTLFYSVLLQLLPFFLSLSFIYSFPASERMQLSSLGIDTPITVVPVVEICAITVTTSIFYFDTVSI